MQPGDHAFTTPAAGQPDRVSVASTSNNGFVQADRHSSHVTNIVKHYITHLNRLHDFPLWD
jgi:hypothetical protein